MKIKRITSWVLGFVLIQLTAFGQEKKALSPDLLPNWPHMESARISNNGMWIMYTVAPNVGDDQLVVKNPTTGVEKRFDRAKRAQFSPQNDYVAFIITTALDTLRKLELDEVPKSKWPSDTLAIYVFEKDTLLKYPDVKSFQLSTEGANWIAFTYNKPLKKETPKSDEKKKKKKKKKSKNEVEKKPKNAKKPIQRKTTDLVILQPSQNTQLQFSDVDAFTLSKYGNSFGVIQAFGDTIDSASVLWVKPQLAQIDTVFLGVGTAKNMVFSEKGADFAWLLSADTGTAKNYAVYYASGAHNTQIIVDTNNAQLPSGHTPSENGNMYFSRNGSKLFFGTAPKVVEEPKDSIPQNEKAMLDVWSYTDLKIQPMQLLQVKREERKTYLAVYFLNTQKVQPLANDSSSYIYPLQNGDHNYAFEARDLAYQKATSWDFPFQKDYYRVDMQTGNRKLLATGARYNIDISPSGQYIMQYNAQTKTWNCLDVASNNWVDITSELTQMGVVLADLESEIPAKPFAYGVVGWSEQEEWVLIQTAYDIYQVDPKGQKAPVALTNGRAQKEHLQIDYINFDRDQDYIKLDSVMLLSVKNKDTNEEGMFVRYPQAERLKLVGFGAHAVAQVTRAKDVNRFIFRTMTFSEYPEIQYTLAENPTQLDDVFEKTTLQSDVLAIQNQYKWGEAKKHYWNAADGSPQKGLLFYPENFDPNKKYPVMVYFYEKYFESEYNYRSFSPSRSVISVPLYTSNDYLVFIPDIHYGTGHPGKDAVNAVVSGAKSLIEFPYVDASKMAIQGQSWGGYQVAHLVTATNMFAAAMAGAPVSNMTSAYGGIRWGSGMSRAFQYEKTQSRIGATLWDAPNLYIENSPVFHLPNVNTPLLIMHNDDDGAVPYYQGIEMFMGLRRLNKPAWLLIYNGEQHNLTRMPNRLDLSMRMFQFFNHYLKGMPIPKWMSEGVPAINKGKNYGFELDK